MTRPPHFAWVMPRDATIPSGAGPVGSSRSGGTTTERVIGLLSKCRRRLQPGGRGAERPLRRVSLNEQQGRNDSPSGGVQQLRSSREKPQMGAYRHQVTSLSRRTAPHPSASCRLRCVQMVQGCSRTGWSDLADVASIGSPRSTPSGPWQPYVRPPGGETQPFPGRRPAVDRLRLR